MIGNISCFPLLTLRLSKQCSKALKTFILLSLITFFFFFKLTVKMQQFTSQQISRIFLTMKQHSIALQEYLYFKQKCR